MIQTSPASQVDFTDATRGRVCAAFDAVMTAFPAEIERSHFEQLSSHFSPGKMLRTRLAHALWQPEIVDLEVVLDAAAGTELVHTATLFHDDVIDEAAIRRRIPTLWKEVGATGAILVGDLFFSHALHVVSRSASIELIRSFVEKVREVCMTEVAHELLYRELEVDAETCCRIARGKTGPLFAFVAEACGGEDAEARSALSEAGYCVGTAYQLADDLLDEIGDESSVGKTLGTDRKRRKFTLAQDAAHGENFLREQISEQCELAMEHVAPWPALSSRLRRYLNDEFLPL
jgi:geranylgeranyl pyrophosphate synthase